MRGATNSGIPRKRAMTDFNSRSPCGERLSLSDMRIKRFTNFNPRSPMQRMTGIHAGIGHPCAISIHVLYKRAAGGIPTGLTQNVFQSTPPLRRVTRFPIALRNGNAISIHAPRVGSDVRLGRHRQRRRHFNPRSPCGERLLARSRPYACGAISIHAPRAGSDGLQSSSL